MLPANDLSLIRYKKSDGSFSEKTRFPGIAMLEQYSPGKAPVKIITVRADDVNGYTEECYRLFKGELKDLSQRMGIDFLIDHEVIVPNRETEAKEKYLLAELYASYEKNGYVYLDLTYGTKMTAIELFASLCYAEIARNCSIKAVLYGNYAFDGSEEGELYDVTRLYHTVRFLETASQMDRKSFENLVESMFE